MNLDPDGRVLDAATTAVRRDRIVPVIGHCRSALKLEH
jgi:hypothetical protein